ncbi:unnamed protein product [Moneuplotes crassus]|uniref:Secreted protein n=1 Tax=Euplotes crassus TaxID=5936 RepID=A0AAD1UGP4_EUPCR|nr:unnamed protein product [Moneuplotes crassus]
MLFLWIECFFCSFIKIVRRLSALNPGHLIRYNLFSVCFDTKSWLSRASEIWSISKRSSCNAGKLDLGNNCLAFSKYILSHLQRYNFVRCG